MARNCIASINLNAITNNYLYAKSLAPESRAIAVIKGNAYGHVQSKWRVILSH